MSTTTATDEHREQQHDHLNGLREEMRDKIDYVEDLTVKSEMREWLKESYSIPSGSLDGHVEARIAAMESEHRMQNHDGVANGIDAFPDTCQGCPSYGGGCPIVTHPTAPQELRRIAEESTDDNTYSLRVRRLARDYECHRIPEFIEEFESEYADKIARGHELLEKTDFDIFESVYDGPRERVDVEFDEGGDY